MTRLVMLRVLQAAVTLAAVAIVVFLATRLVGDPARTVVGPEASQEQYEVVRHELELDRPLPEQFGDYVGDIVSFEFGDSLWQHREAGEVVAETLLPTLLLVGAAMLLALLVSLPLGTFAALRAGGKLDRALSTLSMLTLSAPVFWVGLMLIMLFAVSLEWLPTSGRTAPFALVLPAVTLALPTIGRLTMVVRSAMVEEMARPWIRTARALGLPGRITIGVLALRNAAVAVLTYIGWEAVVMLAGGAIVVEYVFAWGGMGFTLLNAVQRQDITLVPAIVIVIAAMVVLVNLLVDLGYMAIDRRIRVS